jgi:putative sigma-54 modulation protein
MPFCGVTFTKGGKVMKITYTARKVNLRDNFKERVEKKLRKFEKLFSEDVAVSVVVTLEKNRQTVEITIRDNGMVYRAESTMPEMNDALDKTVDILMRQIRRNKTRLEKKIKSGSIDDFVMQTPEIDDIEDDDYKVVRKKQVLIKPISVDEAILEMNMVNHSFFMFTNAETNEVNVVYKRADGNYGLLEPVAD